MGARLSTLKDWLDLATAAAAAVAAIAAVLGVNSWRAQHNATTGLETARGTLRSLLKLRDEVREFRKPRALLLVMLGAEEGTGSEIEEKVIRDRWEKVQDAAAELEAQGIECETLWGAHYVDAAKQLRAAIVELEQSVTDYIGLQKEDFLEFSGCTKEYAVHRIPEAKSIMTSSGTRRGPDAFEEGFVAAVGRIEAFLRLKLAGK